MGTDYTVKVKRKSDGVQVAEFFANELKTVEGRRLGFGEGLRTGDVFGMPELNSATEGLRKDVDAAYSRIQKAELESLLARPDARREILEEAGNQRETVSYLLDELECVSRLFGKLQAAVEDMVYPAEPGAEEEDDFDSRMAYRRNGKDGKCLWTSDVECEVEVSY